MSRNTTDTNSTSKRHRRGDRFLDRRSGEERRQVYALDYFLKDYPERRTASEKRTLKERRCDCVRITKWSSVCPDTDEFDDGHIFVINPRK
jgi:hypothetical protein